MRTVEQIACVGIIGAGTMGAGIAQVAAQAGLTVILYDIDAAMLEKAQTTIRTFITRAAEKGRITQDEAAAAVGRVNATDTFDELAASDLVIEAASEKLAVKQAIFADLARITPPDVILATNTSTLSVTQIGAASGEAGRVVGLHFFNPAPLMALVEVIAGIETQPDVAEIALGFARRLGKQPVRAQDVPGFIVNRVARPYYLEALRLLEEGVADHETIDALLKGGGGFRMGPFELMDLIGMDINYTASQVVYEAYFHEARYRPSPFQRRMVDAGRLGRKTGRGWYSYDE